MLPEDQGWQSFRLCFWEAASCWQLDVLPSEEYAMVAEQQEPRRHPS
jgi:hypothetical protein